MEIDMDKYLPIEDSLHTSIQWTPNVRQETHYIHFFKNLAFLTRWNLMDQRSKGRERPSSWNKSGERYRLSRFEPDRHNQNPYKGVIREVRSKWFITMIRNRVTRRLCDYGMRWVCKTMQRNSTQAGVLAGCTPIESVTGKTVEISEYLDLVFYDRV